MSAASPHEALPSKVAERYRRAGYEVITEPGKNVIPFDLGSYRRDLVALKDDLKEIVEIIRLQTR